VVSKCGHDFCKFCLELVCDNARRRFAAPSCPVCRTALAVRGGSSDLGEFYMLGGDTLAHAPTLEICCIVSGLPASCQYCSSVNTVLQRWACIQGAARRR